MGQFREQGKLPSLTKIDVFKGTLTMEFDGDVINFNISEAIRYPIDDHSYFSFDVFDLWRRNISNC